MDEPVPVFNSVEEEMAYWKEQQLKTSKRHEEERAEKAKAVAAAKARRAEYLMHLRQGAISIHKSIAEFLLLRGGWDKTANPDQKCDMFLASWCARGIEWAALGAKGSAHASQRVLTNYYRGYQLLCYKDSCAMNLQDYCARSDVDVDVTTLMPETFVFQFDTEARIDRKAFKAAYARHAKIEGERNVWIVKPARLQCGQGIFIEDNLDKILEALDREAEGSVVDPSAGGEDGEGEDLPSEEEGADLGVGTGPGTDTGGADASESKREPEKVKTAWVIQKYMERPLLCSGGRKFDIRVWVLLTADYRIGLYREGVLRTTAVPYSLDNLDDQFAHLSNHCIATQHPDYGKIEATNEMWFRDFDDFLVATYGPEKSFYTAIYPQIQDIVRHSLLAVKDQMENSATATFESFHLFGYDIMVSDDFRATLIEINSSPAVAADLMPGMTRAIVAETVDPLFPLPTGVLDRLEADGRRMKRGGNRHHAEVELSRQAALKTAKYATIEQALQGRKGKGKGKGKGAKLQQHKEFDERFDMLC